MGNGKEGTSAFIIMAFASDNPELEDIHQAIKQTCREAGIIAFRSDEIEHNEKITDMVVSGISRSDFIIADMTYERPNVYYELGYAHGLGKKVIMIAREGTTLHFDIKDYNAIFYRNLTALRQKLSQRISASAPTYSIGRTPTTFCTKCLHFMNREPEGARKDIWYNHYCKASPLKRRIDPLDGVSKPHTTNSFGMHIFVDEEYQHCRDVNDGNCPKFQPL
ncbi:MAG: hypothetical protein AB7O43_03260 [Hyphomicrobiaceae bacterium]